MRPDFSKKCLVHSVLNSYNVSSVPLKLRLLVVTFRIFLYVRGLRILRPRYPFVTLQVVTEWRQICLREAPIRLSASSHSTPEKPPSQFGKYTVQTASFLSEEGITPVTAGMGTAPAS